MSKLILFSLLTVLGLFIDLTHSTNFMEDFKQILSTLDAQNNEILSIAEVNDVVRKSEYFSREDCKKLFGMGIGEGKIRFTTVVYYVKNKALSMAFKLFVKLDSDEDSVVYLNDISPEERQFFEQCDIYHVGWVYYDDVPECVIPYLKEFPPKKSY